MKGTTFLLLSLLVILSYGSNESSQDTNTTKDNATTGWVVHIVPHTHDDIGWLKTVDQYFYDSRMDITNQGVQYILDDILPLLHEDINKRFIYVEIGFFKRWWDEQSDTIKDQVKGLVASKQFEFINGGWCMNDEAAVYYEDSIEQMTLGHKFILDYFQTVPTIGWHIDPFGHASAQAALFAQMGFNAFYFSRIDHQDKDLRSKTQALEMLWVPNTSQGIENAMFTQVNYNGYGDPPGFCFDIICQDEPIMDDPRLTGYNIDSRAKDLVNYYAGMNNSYKSNIFMHTAGGDFNWMAPEQNYKNWDKLVNYINANSTGYNMTLVYSTPSQYIAAVNPLNLTYPTKSDDFFPYADGDNAYWTGYFVSRVSLKGLMREQGQLLQGVKRLVTQALWLNSSAFVSANYIQVDNAIIQLTEAVSTNQHHDAAPGTSKQAVAEDYKLYLSNAADLVRQDILVPLFQERAQADLNLTNLDYQYCHLNATASLCGVTFNNLNNNTVVLTIYNSGPARYTPIKVKVPHGRVQVSTTDGDYLPTDVVCPNRTDLSDCLLVFSDNLAGYALAHYYLVPVIGSNEIVAQTLSGAFVPYSLKVNSLQSLTVNTLNSFTLTYCKDKTPQSCVNTSFTLDHNYYKGYAADNDQNSGAYIFRPSNDTINGSIPYNTPSSANVYQGDAHIHVRIYGDKVMTDMRVYRDLASGIEVESFVDSIDISDGFGKEVVLSVQVPGLDNKNTFYTDSMGMELQKRVTNFRPTWNLTVTQPVSGNYYPVQSAIKINNTAQSASLVIVPDRAQGGASIQPGQIELMIHRRLLRDDGRGVAEALNETDSDGQGLRQWVRHIVLVNVPNFVKLTHRNIQHLRDTPLISLLAPLPPAPSGPTFVEKTAPLSDNFADLDSHIKVMARPLSPASFLLRFQNLDDGTARNVSATAFTSSVWGTGTVVEMSLTNNQDKATMIKNRLNWNNLQLNNPAFAKVDYSTLGYFSLRPLEIRTFKVTFNPSQSQTETETVDHSDTEVISV